MTYKLIFCLVPIAAALNLTSCVDPAALNQALSYNPVNYSPGKSYAQTDSQAYNHGYRAGKTDALQQRDHNLSRHRSEFNTVSRAVFKNGYNTAYRNYMPHHTTSYQPNNYSPDYSRRDYQSRPNKGNAGPIEASVGQGSITITQGGRKLSRITTASPNIEKHHFIHGKKQIVIKSRGNHGPATVQLFDTKTGVLKGKVLAYAIEHGQPAWARGMQD